MKIIFRDMNPRMIEAFRQTDATVDAEVGSIFSDPVDAVVSPSNSFGFLDGGVDWHYTQRFGMHVQETLRERIQKTLMGELLVGEAMAIPTRDGSFPWLIAAPTMRVPMLIHDPMDVFLASKVAVRTAVGLGLASIVLPGMGTGCGKLEPRIAAYAILRGIASALEPSYAPKSWKQAQERHYNLVG